MSAEALVLNDKLSRSVGYRSWLQNGPKLHILVRAEGRFGLRWKVGRHDADQERSQKRSHAIQRLSLDRPFRLWAERPTCLVSGTFGSAAGPSRSSFDTLPTTAPSP